MATKKGVSTKKEKVTNVVFLLDETGSMESCKGDTIGGFNQFLTDQKKSKEKIQFTLTLFNSSKIEKRYIDKDIKKIDPLSEDNYKPSNLTPLWDAIGTTINELSVKEDVLFVILTDGHENASKEFNPGTVRDMIKSKESDKRWKFLFLGADLSDFGDAQRVGINFNVNYLKADTVKAYGNLSRCVTSYANTGQVQWEDKGDKTVGKKTK